MDVDVRLVEKNTRNMIDLLSVPASACRSECVVTQSNPIQSNPIQSSSVRFDLMGRTRERDVKKGKEEKLR